MSRSCIRCDESATVAVLAPVGLRAVSGDRTGPPPAPSCVDVEELDMCADCAEHLHAEVTA